MSQDHANPSQNQDKNQDYDEQKIEKARARKHKVSGVQFFYIFLLLAAVCIALYVIEFYRQWIDSRPDFFSQHHIFLIS